MTDLKHPSERAEAQLWAERVQALENEIARLREKLRGVGANRYWEERWRDEAAEVERLQRLLAHEGAIAERLAVEVQAAAKLADEVRQVSADIQPLLKSRGPEVQSAVLADLVSLWLAGLWPPELRAALLKEWVAYVQDLVPVSELQIFGPEGHPAGRRP